MLIVDSVFTYYLCISTCRNNLSKNVYPTIIELLFKNFGRQVSGGERGKFLTEITNCIGRFEKRERLTRFVLTCSFYNSAGVIVITLSSKYFYIYKRKYSFRRISNREYCVCGRFMFMPCNSECY